MTAAKQTEFLHAERVRGWLAVSAGVVVAALVAGLATSSGDLDRLGRPLGTDFVAFRAAARVALTQGAAAVWDGARLEAEELSAFPGLPGFVAYFYPPVFLLVCLPLGLVPHVVALGAWLAATGIAAWRGLVSSARGLVSERWAAIAFLAQPAVVVVAGHGQNAFLSTALYAFAARFADERPRLAGVLLGFLVYKPQLALLLPVALVAAGGWRPVVATAVAALAWCALSLVAFGADAWVAFFEMSRLARATLDLGLVEPEKMVGVHAAVRVLGGSATLAWAVQGLVAAATVAATVVAARRGRSAEGAVVLAAVGGFLVAPFALDYDTMVLAVAMVFVARAGTATGFHRFEKVVLLAAFVLPAAARPIAFTLHLPIAPVVIGALFVVVARRVAASEGGRGAVA